MGWTLVACMLTAAFGVVVPTFQDVSIEKGLLSFLQIDRQRLGNNKYWGSTIADLDRDGLYDLFLCNHGNNPELYFMQQDKKFLYKDVSLRSHDLHATAAADVNNDGYLDFIVNTGGSNGNNVNGKPIVHIVEGDQSFYRRLGAEKYRDVFGLGEISQRGRAMMFLDMNADGYLDLLLLNQKNFSSFDRHIVYENLRNGEFRVRRNTGLEASEGFWAQVIDANSDSYPDVLILQWRGVQLWLGNARFQFQDGTYLIPEAADLKYVRCAAEIDFDGDGDLDLILARGQTMPPRPDVPDVLLENREGIFVRVADPGFVRTRDHFHVTVGDFNNDGLMDMYFSVMTQFTQPRFPDWMYLNEGGGKFALAPPHGTESAKFDSDGDNANAFDYNLDGRLDLLVGSRNDAWKLYENRTFLGSLHYLLVRVGEPRGQIAEPFWFRRKALGALVKVSCGGKVFVQRVGSPGQSHSQSYMDTLHFGVGACTWVDSIEIHYTGEVLVKRSGTAVDQIVTVGMYFPCPPGWFGQDCNEPMVPCSRIPCAYGCETVELTGYCASSPGGCLRLYCSL